MENGISPLAFFYEWDCWNNLSKSPTAVASYTFIIKVFLF